MAGLAGIGLDQVGLAALGGAFAVAGVLLRGWAVRSNRLKNTLAAALADDRRDLVFERLAGAARHGNEHISGLVSWEEDGLGGSLELSSEGEAPQERALMSWLVREAESRDELLTAPAHESAAARAPTWRFRCGARTVRSSASRLRLPAS